MTFSVIFAFIQPFYKHEINTEWDFGHDMTKRSFILGPWTEIEPGEANSHLLVYWLAG